MDRDIIQKKKILSQNLFHVINLSGKTDFICIARFRCYETYQNFFIQKKGSSTYRY